MDKDIDMDLEQQQPNPISELIPEPLEIAPKKRKGIFGIGAAILAVLVKFKFLLIFLKLSKFGGTAISMVLTIAIYAVTFGWLFAVGIVALLFVHEMGHYVACRVLGLKVSGPVFVPFVGAFIGLKETPKDAEMDAKIGYGGPLAGSLAAGLVLLIYFVTGSQLALALAYTGFLLNLFNLIPVHPLDGGRVVTAVSPFLWLIGIPVLLYFIIKSFNPVLVLILILGLIQAYKLWKGKDDRSYYAVPAETRNMFAILYFGLIAGLGAGIWFTLQTLGTPPVY